MADHETLTLGGGCFWCLEAVYRETEGVVSAVSGYMGGASANPTYNQVCSGTSGHVEVVQVTFDPMVISIRDLLEIFFVISRSHDAEQPGERSTARNTGLRSSIKRRSRKPLRKRSSRN